MGFSPTRLVCVCHNLVFSLINLTNGVLDTPLNINFNGIPLQGNLSVRGKDAVVEANAFLEVENNDIRDLEQWFNLDGIDGSLGRFSINATTSGDNLPALVSSLTTKLEIREANLSYGDSTEGQNVSFLYECTHLNQGYTQIPSLDEVNRTAKTCKTFVC